MEYLNYMFFSEVVFPQLHCIIWDGAVIVSKKKGRRIKKVRIINVNEIKQNIKEMCIEANHYLSEDMSEGIQNASKTEKSPLGKQILNQLEQNLQIAAQDKVPICQDTGMAVIFIVRD